MNLEENTGCLNFDVGHLASIDPTDDRLARYRISLHEEPDDEEVYYFECAAEDPAHAIEQAQDAVPGCEIVLVKRISDF